MKQIYSTIMMLALMVAALSFTACGGDDDDDDLGLKVDYDVLQINGVSYACYGYRSFITYTSTWDLSNHSGEILLPCGNLSDAKKGEYDYDYMYSIYLEGNQDLKKGSKLENFSPEFEDVGEWDRLSYSSGSATITDKKDDKYITVKFDSFKFGNGSKSYTLNGTVQLDLDED